MASINEAIAKAITSMAFIGSEEAKESLKAKAQQYTLSSWRVATVGTSAAVGGATGVLGGPVGLLLEGVDLAYLLTAAGRGCYGIGHILGRDVDYETDIPMILAIWCGAAEAASTIAPGKIGIKVAGKAGLQMGANVAGKLAGKLAAKSAMKFTGKGGALVAGWACTQLAAKIVTKMGVKWIPILGGIVSAGINMWIINGLLGAAEKMYGNDYVVLSDKLAAGLGEAAVS